MAVMSPIRRRLERIAKEIRADKKHRARAWGHCFSAFQDSISKGGSANLDQLALQLAAYLAAFGMYRGRSPLLRKTHRVHQGALREILRPVNLENLNQLTPMQLNDEGTLPTLSRPMKSLRAHYSREFGADPANARYVLLVQKVLLGTLGCTIAFDTNVVASLREPAFATIRRGRHRLTDLAQYYIKHPEFEEFRKTQAPEGFAYPPLRLLDLYLWYRLTPKEAAEK